MFVSAVLLVVSDREPLAWMLRTDRFAVRTLAIGHGISEGDQVLVYTTRGCFRSPERDRGRLIAVGSAVSGSYTLDKPVVFRGRSFPVGFRLKITGLVELGQGLELAALAGRLELLPTRAALSSRLRRAVVPVSASDAALLVRLLTPLLRPVEAVIDRYEDACRFGTDRPDWTKPD